MKPVEWFDLNVDGVGAFDGSGSVASRDRRLAVFDVPDVVRLPAATPGSHGGRVLRVLGTLTAPCPQCRRDVVCWVLEDRFVLACCRTGCGFVVCRAREGALRP